VGTVSVRHAAASAGDVRRLLVADLRAWAVDGPALEEAALLVTELVGNAVRHAHPLADGRILVSWRAEAGRLHMRVTDGGSTLDKPHVRHAGPQDTRGRGLTIVAALAGQWGVERTLGSTTVWATLPVPSEVRRTPGQALAVDRAARGVATSS
jgi:anti-sigma regulatory factor (Ser/Thr protein kinase)